MANRFLSRSLPLAFAAGFLVTAQSQSLNESQAVRQALEKNPDLAAARIEFDRQKLTYKSARDEFALQAEVWAPYTKTWTENYLLDMEYDRDETGLNGSLSRLFRWGGLAEIEAGTSFDLSEPDSQGWSALINLRQPFLKGAGKYAPQAVSLYSQKNDLEANQARFLDEWSSGVSTVRQAYWNWIAQAALIRIREREVDYARKELLWQKARFKLGDAAEIDTMTAGLQLLQAQSNHASALQNERSSRRALAEILGSDPSNIVEPVNPAIDLPPIGGFAQAIGEAESASTELRILDLERTNAERQLGYARNRRLPSLEVSAFARRDGSMQDGPVSQNIGIGAELRFDLFSRRPRNDAARVRLDLALNRLRREKFRRSLRSDLEDLYDTWRSDSLRFELAQRQWALAQRRYEAILQEERLGAIDTQTRQKALDDLTQAEIGKLDKQLALKRVEITLDRITHKGITKFGVKLP